MKFEMPLMNISMFEMENVATTASTATTNLAAAEAEAERLANNAGGAVAKIKVTF